MSQPNQRDIERAFAELTSNRPMQVSRKSVAPKKPKLTPVEQKEQALSDIFNFYAKQHGNVQKLNAFDDFKSLDRLQKGEMNKMLQDFDIRVSRKSLFKIFKKVSHADAKLNLDEFKKTLPLIAIEYSEVKQAEIKYRLFELKNLLEYPKNKGTVTLTEEILCFMNGISSMYDHLGRKVKIDEKNQIDLFVEQAQDQQENQRADKILHEIENIMKRKMKFAWQDDLFHKLDKKQKGDDPKYKNETRLLPRKPTPKTNPLQRGKEEDPLLHDNTVYMLTDMDAALKETPEGQVKHKLY